MSRKLFISISLLIMIMSLSFYACKKDNTIEEAPKTTAYVAPSIQNFRTMPIDAANPMTVEGIALGKKLFFDPILSRDSSVSCSSCHKQENSFSDPRPRSRGVDDMPGPRHSMALINLAWQKDRFFWDGRVNSLREQAEKPIEDELEMHLPIAQAEQRLQRHPEYVDLFWKAFGTKTVTKDLITKAIEQFEKTLLSYNSKFDKYARGEMELSASELRGLDIFKTEKGDCFHCHSSTAPEVFISPDRTFANNGLDSVSSVLDFADFGLGKFTGNTNDYGRFKIPTLRNLAFTAPYMHDARFATLDEVIDFYNDGPKGSLTLEPIMREKANKRVELTGHWGLSLSTQEKADLKAFLLTLSDSTFIR